MIYAFGSCNVLNCSTAITHRDTNSWITYASEILGENCANFGEKAVDNNYIYHAVLKSLDTMPSDSLVVVGWADVSSRLFSSDGVDQTIIDNSLTYPGLGDDQWIRSKGRQDSIWDGSFNYRQTTGNGYYDTYFHNYYNEYIAELELLQKVSSLNSILNDCGIEHIFTANKNLACMEIVQHVNWFFPEGLGIVEYTKHANLAISDTNCHLTPEGHEIVAELFVKYYNDL